jgi:hypothetical protein
VEQADLLKRAIAFLEAEKIPYLLAGSLASGVYGEPRLTHDIDIVVELAPAQIDSVCAAFPPPEFYLSRDAAADAVRTGRQFNVLHPASGNEIDFMISRGDPWARSQLSRRRRELLIPGCEGFTAAPEDVIIAKLLYYREGHSEKHIRDIVGMLDVSGDRIDREYLAHWVAQLGLSSEWQQVSRQT